ncbi:hypothetical protein GYB61_00140 [bacterium]|nr:hypothetical protein [bacterium]
MSIRDNTLAVAESLINRAVANSPGVAEAVQALSGKVLQITLTGLDQVVYLAPMGSRVQVLAEAPDHPDVKLAGRVGEFLRLAAAQGDAKQAALKDAAITIEGDAMLAQQFAAMMDALDVSPEAHLEPLLGATGAAQVGEIGRALFGLGKAQASRVGSATFAQWNSESGAAVAEREVGAWADEVSQITAQIDGLEVRVKRFERKVSEIPDGS